MRKSYSHKQIKIEEIKKSLAAYPHVLLFAHTQIKVPLSLKLRQEITASKGITKVYKNTFFKKAVSQTEWEKISEYLKGPNIVVMTKEEPLTFFKKIHLFLKKHQPDTQILAGYIEGKMHNADALKALALLPSREELLGAIVLTLTTPLHNLLQILQSKATSTTAK